MAPFQTTKELKIQTPTTTTGVKLVAPPVPTPQPQPASYEPGSLQALAGLTKTPPKINAENLQPTTGTYVTPQPKPYTNTQIAVESTASKPIEQPKVQEQPKEQTEREQTRSYLDKILNRNITEEKTRIREDAGLLAKQEEATRLQGELASRKRAYEKELKELEKNKQGTFGGALESQMGDLRRKANEELADIAIQAEFALNNYQGAEKILNAQIADLNDEYDMQVKNYQLAQDFLQNDLSESEKLQIQNNMQIEKEKRDNAEYRLRASYDNSLRAASGGGGSSQAQTGISTISAITGKPLTEGERLSLGYANRMKEANQTINNIGSQFTGISSYVGGILPNFAKTSDRQQFEQAQRNFINSVLRRESGAVISEEEFDNARQQYFPQPGDGDAVVQQKAQNRATAVENMMVSAGQITSADESASSTPESLRAKYNY
jgi:hypothetical protein